MTLSTDPMQETMLTLKERRPVSLLITCEKTDGSRVDLTGASARLVIADTKRKGGDVKVTAIATTVSAVDGTVRFDVQGDDLDFGAGVYDLAITLTTAEGYAATIVEGPLELTRNPDPAVPDDYVTVVPPLGLTVRFRDANRVTVRTNHVPDQYLLDLVERAENAAGQGSDAAGIADAKAAAAAAASAAAAAAASAAAAAAAAAEAAAEAGEVNLAELNAAVAAAAASAASADASSDQSGTSAGAAQTARTAAELALDQAIAARDAAIAAKNAAEAAAAGGGTDTTARAAAAAVQAELDQFILDLPDNIQNMGEDMFVNQQSHTDAVHVHGIRVMTQAAYDALEPNTISDCLYVIRG